MEERPPLPADTVSMLNASRGGYNVHLGLEFVSASREAIVAHLDVDDRHRQPYGLVHGGVYASIVETLASTGAALDVLASGRTTVGLDNSTSFVRAVRAGRLVATAKPVHRGRRTQVWDVTIEHDDKVVATGRVRSLVLEPGAAVAGEKVDLV